MNDDLAELFVNVGDDIRAEHRNGVIRAIRRRQLRGGKGVLIKQYDTHQTVSYYGAPQTVIAHAWKPRRATRTDEKEGVLFGRGLVNGIEATCEDKLVSDADCVPLAIPGYDEDRGECLLYVELTLDPDTWRATETKMAAYAKRPDFQPFTARKLVGIASIDGGIEARAFFDFAFDSSERKASGAFKPWWRAV